MRAKPYLYYYKTIYLSFLISLLIFPSKPKLLEKFDDYKKYGMIEKNLSLSKVAKGINFGWGMTFIDDHSLLITEKSGGILKVNTITGNKTRIKHNLYSSQLGKNPFSNGQGGLLDILFHNGFVYISYSHLSKKILWVIEMLYMEVQLLLEEN